MFFEADKLAWLLWLSPTACQAMDLILSLAKVNLAAEAPDPDWRDITEYVKTVRHEGSTVIPIDRPPIGRAWITLENEVQRKAPHGA
jgi:hypothetical protein